MRCIARLWISAAFSTCLVAGIPMLALVQTDVLATCRVEGEGQLAACTAVLAQPSLDPKDRVEALLFHAEAIRRTGDKLAILKGHALNIEALVFSPDGATLYSGARDARVMIWDVGRIEQK